MKEPVLIHIPHSSLVIPAQERKEILLSDTELFREQLKITDRYTDELYYFKGCTQHKNEVSRLILDPERFRNNQDEEMSEFGMGAIYTHTTDGKLLKNMTDPQCEDQLKKYYDPYHQAFEDKVEKLLNSNGKCLIIDGHSFPEKPLPFEDKKRDRPDICIGTCDFHTPKILVEAMEAFVKRRGMTVQRNTPFSGTIVPMKYYKKDPRISSVMIEINRKCYMDENTGEKLPSFPLVQHIISELIGLMIQELKIKR